MRYTALFIFLVMITSLVSQSVDVRGSEISADLQEQKAKWFYSSNVSIRAGYQFLDEAPGLTESTNNLIRKGVLLQDSTIYRSNSEIALASTRQNNGLLISIESLWNLNFNLIPGLQNLEFLKNFQNLRGGVLVDLYPLLGSAQKYSGPLVYTNANPPNTALSTITYQAQFDVNDAFFAMAPQLALYYFSPEFKIVERNLLLFTGITFGVSLLTGKRKLSMTTEPVIIPAYSATRSFEARANYQDSVFNDLSFRFVVTTGAMYELITAHWLELRLGYTFHGTQLMVERSGAWSETETASGATGFAIGRRQVNESAASAYSLHGFMVQLGYSVRIL